MEKSSLNEFEMKNLNLSTAVLEELTTIYLYKFDHDMKEILNRQ